MASATEERIRACLIREGVCEDEAAQRLAAVIAEEIVSGDEARVERDVFEARINQLGREFAERDARLAREMRDFITSMQELERQRDERERQRDERERERDERERERERNWEQRYDRFQRVVTIGLSVGFTAMGILIAVLALVA